MVQIALIGIGIYALITKRLAISKKSELRQPNLRTFGIITIVTVLIVMIAGSFLPSTSNLHAFVYVVYLFVPIVAAVKLKQPVLDPKTTEKYL